MNHDNARGDYAVECAVCAEVDGCICTDEFLALAAKDTLPSPPPAPILDQYAEICRIANMASERCQRISHDIRQALAMANSGRCEGLNRVLEARWQERCGKGRAA